VGAGSNNDVARRSPELALVTRDVFGVMRQADVAQNDGYAAGPVPAVSLVICSRNRGATLHHCLERVSELRFVGDWELILVDNGSTDNTREVMLRYLRDTPARCLYIHDAAPGNGAGRNAAAVHARANLICFIDDDCYIDPAYLENVVKHFEDPSLGFATGRTMLYDKNDFPITIIEKLAGEYYPAGSFIRYGQIAGANMSFRRRVLFEVEGFDEAFGAGTPFACEDWEIAYRASAKGWAGAYLPDVVVWHHHRRRASEAKSLNLFYEFGAGATYVKFLVTPGNRARTLGHLAKHMAHHIRHGNLGLLGAFVRGGARYLRQSRKATQ
jgi:glycosyltransferase involved in cell wall biosynthesis